jgi:hypothetical protein
MTKEKILGNVPPETLEALLDPRERILEGNGKRWAESVTSRLRLVEVTITPKLEEPEKKEARVVLEAVVEEGAIISSLSPDFGPKSLGRYVEWWWNDAWRLRSDTCRRVCSQLRFKNSVLV